MSPIKRDTLEATPHTLIDLRWMIPGYTGGIEVMARALLNTLLRSEVDHEFTVMLPAVTRYDFNVQGRKNIHLQVCDGPGYYFAKLGTLLGKAIYRKTFRAGEIWVQARRQQAQTAISPSGIIYPDLYPLRNLLILPDLQHEYHPEFFTPQERDNRSHYYTAAIEHADHILTISEFTRKTVIERMKISPEKVTTAHLGVDPIFREPAEDTNRVLQKYNLEPHPYLFFPGNTWTHKNHRAALQALQHLKDKHDLKPLLVCTGTPKEAHDELLALSARLGVEAQFRFLGYCPQEDLPALYQQAVALVFPSLFEGFGMPVVEAMYCGCPVICSNTTSLPEVGGEAAYYIDPLDPEMLAEAIFQVISDPALRQDLIQRGREQARKFSWVKFTSEILRALNRLEGGDKAGEAEVNGERINLVLRPALPNRQGDAQNLLHRAKDQWRLGKRLEAAKDMLKVLFLAPEVVFTTVVFPSFRDRVLRKIFKLFPV
jgi:glycosyltransferase involved in cell wall biosynthesis